MDKYIGTRLDGRYAIEELIGEGGMANVYRAKDLTNDTTVAVKLLKDEYKNSEELVRRFINESRAISVLNHPNIVKVYDVSVTDKVYYMAMEYISGITMKEYIEQRGEPLTYKEVVHFIGQTLRAMQHAHDKGIVHRDIKPQNIMILEDGTIRVMDFGIARLARSEIHTAEEQAVGSVHYISPEQAQGADTDHRADIYSLGIVMYEMLSGQLPFEDENAVSVAIKQISDKAVPLKEINPSAPQGLADIVARAMAKDPRMRYQSSLEMLRDIEEFKQNPSIKFEYDYLDEEPQRYVNKVMGDNKKPMTKEKKAKKKKKKHKRRMGLLMPVTFGLTIAIVGVCVLYSLDLVQNSPNPLFADYEDINLPDFTSMELDDVQQMFANEPYDELRMEIEEVYNPDVKAGTVISQNPVSNNDDPLVVKENQVVYLVVSRGIQTVEIPDLTAYTKQEAEEEIHSLGMMPYVQNMEVADGTPPGVVIGSEPEAGTLVQNLPGSVVTIFISSDQQIYYVTVPTLTGIESLDDAQRAVDQAGLLMGNTKEEYNEAPAGTIIAQSPQPGVQVTVYETIYLTVSKGPEPPPAPAEPTVISVPDVSGMPLSTAQATLAGLGIPVSLTAVNHPTIPFDTIVSQNPPGGGTIAVGSAVMLWVSHGPEATPAPEPEPTPTPTPDTTSTPTV